jgi:hypothetical protein
MKFFETLRALAAGDGRKRRQRDAAAVAAEIAAIEAALAQANTEEAAAKTRLTAAQGQYDQLVLGDAVYEVKQQHKRAVEEAEDLVRTLPLFKNQQERRLVDLKAELKHLKGQALRRQLDAAGAEYLRALRPFVDKWQTFVAMRDAGIKAGFGHELSGWTPLPLPIDLAEHVRLFEEHAAQSSLSAAAMPASKVPPPPKPMPKPVASRPAGSLQHAVRLDAPQQGPMRTKPREPRRDGPPTAGQVHVEFLHPNVEIDGVLTIPGDHINLAADHARALVERGIVKEITQ